jgi:hypothetical protein
MSASAYSAQGAKLEIGTTAANKTITAISQANPAVITATAHGFLDGDVIKVAAVVGMTQINGKVGVVTVVDANNFRLNGIDSTAYTAYGSAGTATPTKVKLGNWKEWSGFDGQSSEIDTTDLDSVAKEFRAGLQDPGQLTLGLQTKDDDEGQMALNGSKAASGPSSLFLLTFANGKTRTFRAFCKQFTEAGGVDKTVDSQAALRITGAVTKG